MKKIPNPFNWYPRDFWYWPDEDEKLLQVIDWVHDLDQVLPLIPQKRVCIQAGGACGVWPAYLSKFFEIIYTIEPSLENLECLIKNVKFCDCSKYPDCPHEQLGQIEYFNSALGEKEGRGQLKLDNSELGNSGAYYLGVGETVDIDYIDFHGFENVDFICLDIEGFEEKALRGAAETIERCNPVIMIEEKPLPHLAEGEHLKARQFLESIGYQEVLKIHRDVVFKRG